MPPAAVAAEAMEVDPQATQATTPPKIEKVRWTMNMYSMFQLVWNIIWRHNSRSNRDNLILKKALYR